MAIIDSLKPDEIIAKLDALIVRSNRSDTAESELRVIQTKLKELRDENQLLSRSVHNKTSEASTTLTEANVIESKLEEAEFGLLSDVRLIQRKVDAALRASAEEKSEWQAEERRLNKQITQLQKELAVLQRVSDAPSVMSELVGRLTDLVSNVRTLSPPPRSGVESDSTKADELNSIADKLTSAVAKMQEMDNKKNPKRVPKPPVRFVRPPPSDEDRQRSETSSQDGAKSSSSSLDSHPMESFMDSLMGRWDEDKMDRTLKDLADRLRLSQERCAVLEDAMNVAEKELTFWRGLAKKGDLQAQRAAAAEQNSRDGDPLMRVWKLAVGRYIGTKEKASKGSIFRGWREIVNKEKSTRNIESMKSQLQKNHAKLDSLDYTTRSYRELMDRHHELKRQHDETLDRLEQAHNQLTSANRELYRKAKADPGPPSSVDNDSVLGVTS